MHNTTFIPGRDAALETTIQTLQGKLQHLGFHIEERSWLNPVDGIWSVHIGDRDCPLLFANGKDATRLACLASTLGEFFECLSTDYFWNLLTLELQQLYNPQGSVDAQSLVDFNSGHEECSIFAIPYVRERDGQTVYFPVNIIGNLIQLSDKGDSAPYLDALALLYGAGSLAQAHALIMQEDRFMGLSAPGLALNGCEKHHKLQQAYAKVRVAHV